MQDYNQEKMDGIIISEGIESLVYRAQLTNVFYKNEKASKRLDHAQTDVIKVNS